MGTGDATADAASVTAAGKASPADVSNAISVATTGLAKSSDVILSSMVKSTCTSMQALGNVSGAIGCLSTGLEVQQLASSPSSGATLQAAATTTVLIVNCPTALALLTVGFPANPVDGQRFTVCTVSAITLMSFTGGTVKGALTVWPANGFARFIYSASIGAWVRAG